MRISDWSSDVCSSDLPLASDHRDAEKNRTAVHHQDALRGVPDHLCAGDGGNGAGNRLSARISGVGRQAVDGRVQRVGVSGGGRSEEHTSELQSLMRISYAVFCLKKKTNTHSNRTTRRKQTPTHPTTHTD